MPSLETAREGSVPPVLFGICTAAWNPGVAGLAPSSDACRPISRKTDRARRGTRRFNIGGPPTCRATVTAVARFATVQAIDAPRRESANRVGGPGSGCQSSFVADTSSGALTFLFTDMEGSTRLLHALGEDYAGV